MVEHHRGLFFPICVASRARGRARQLTVSFSMDFSWLRQHLPDSFDGDLDALWQRFEATADDPNPHGFVAFLFHDGVIPGKTARDVLVSGDVAFSLGVPVARGHEHLGVIGRGAMGEVIVARDSILRRAVAVKRHMGEEGKGQFLAEAQITAQLDHPGIVPIYGFEESGEFGYSMKLIAGGTLADVVAKARAAHDAGRPAEPGLTLKSRVDFFLHICDAMAYAHARGVVHRDLKPENIMVGDFNEILVADWGIGHLRKSDDPAPSPESISARSVSEPGLRILGTPVYMSPEQAYGNAHALLPPSDQYALGLILYELVTLQRANRSGEPRAAILAARKAHKEPMEHYAQLKIDPAIEAIVDRATQPWPHDRYPGVQELAADVRRFALGEEVLAFPDTWHRAIWRRLQRHPLTVMLALLGIVVVAAAMTTLSLFNALATERQAEQDRATLAELVGAVTSHGQGFDRQLVEVEVLLEGLTAAVASRMHLPAGPFEADIYRPEDLGTPAGPEDAAPSKRYKQVVSLEHAVYLIPDGVDAASVMESRRRLGDIDDVMKTIFVRSAGADPASIGAPARSALFSSDMPLMWAYVQLEEGLMINFPGNATYPEDYDGRQRPWYRNAPESQGPRWGQLYPDATGTGFLLPCNQSVYDPEQRFLGVAGLDMTMDHLIATMDVPGLRGDHTARLLDSEGGVLLTSMEVGMESKVSTEGNRTKKRSAIGVPALVAAARAGRASGFVLDGEDLHVFASLKSVPWTLVATVSAEAYGLE